MIEKEYKVLLSKKKYEELLNLFDFSQAFTQINFYYKERGEEHLDTTIRVRAVNNQIFLQVKEPISKEKGIHVKKEYQREIKEIPYRIESEILNSLCKAKTYQDCFLIGILVTERKVVIRENYEIAMDINYYCGVVDYELEIEFDKNVDVELIQLLENKGVYKKVNSEGKYTRFINNYFKLKGKKNSNVKNL